MLIGVNENLACIFHIDLLSPIAPKFYSYGLKLMDAITTVTNELSDDGLRSLASPLS